MTLKVGAETAVSASPCNVLEIHVFMLLTELQTWGAGPVTRILIKRAGNSNAHYSLRTASTVLTLSPRILTVTLGTLTDILGEITLAAGGCSGHCRMSGNISGLYSLDIPQLWQLRTSPDIDTCLLGVRSHLLRRATTLALWGSVLKHTQD